MELSVHPFPADRIVRRVTPPLTGDQIAVMRAGPDAGTVVYACEQDLHAAVLVACADLLAAREAHVAAAAAVRARQAALTEAARTHAAQVETRARALALQLVLDTAICAAVVAAFIGVVAALAWGVVA
jgi:hypothetical protein